MWVNYLETQQPKEEISDQGGTHNIYEDVAESWKCNVESFTHLKPRGLFDFPFFSWPPYANKLY